MSDHDCVEYLSHRTARYTERHGLDCGPYETGEQEYSKCRVCGQRYEPSEVSAMYADQSAHAEAPEVVAA